MTDDLELRRLVAQERYMDAEEHCRTRLAEGGDPLYWTTQLGYVCFLNETDPVSYYERSVDLFAQLAESYPNDVNSRFWSGYLRLVVIDDVAGAVSRLNEVLRHAPRHPYALLALSGSESDPVEKRHLLAAVLRVQPSNFRALRDLAYLNVTAGSLARALEIVDRMKLTEPYTETAFGIMNFYINDVLTGATHADVWVRELESSVA